jgi:omega-6 fatty acid desaturase (delta-12 desaturase)
LNLTSTDTRRDDAVGQDALLWTQERGPVAEPSESKKRSSQAQSLGQQAAKQFPGFGTDLKRSLFQLTTTAIAFVAMLVVIAMVAEDRYWLALLLAIPTAGLLVRLFIVQHDCGHGSYFRSRFANDFVGRIISVVTLTPYGYWKQGHAIHHASNGNLERRGRGDVETLTVDEYQALSPARKLGYRLYRNPLVQVGIGAPLNFVVLQRIPRGLTFRDRSARYSILALNAVLVLVFGLAIALLGAGKVLGAYLPVMIIAAWIGNWLFYVQHQFEDTYWEQHAEWNFHAAALHGSSYFDLHPILQWFSGNIGLHHIHHLCSRIPNYRLQACFDASPDLRRMAKRITLRESLRCWQLVLWDEQRRLMVRFSDLKPQSA